MADLREEDRDAYRSMNELLAAEPPQNYSFDIMTIGRSQRCAILAPHGGKIEWGTNQIAKAIAELGGYRFFAFNGDRKGGQNKHYLHVESPHYENADTRLNQDVSCLALIEPCEFVLAIHGARNWPKHLAKDAQKNWRQSDRKIYVGGRDERLKIKIFDELVAIHHDLKFKIAYLTDTPQLAEVKPTIESRLSDDIILSDVLSDPKFCAYGGLHQNNICNKGKSLMGAQLEITRNFRDHLVPEGAAGSTPDFQIFVNAARASIESRAA